MRSGRWSAARRLAAPALALLLASCASFERISTPVSLPEAPPKAEVTPAAPDVFNDPQMGAMALARSKIQLASFSRAQELEADGVGVGISQRAGFDPYGAVRFLTAMGRNAELRAPANNGVDSRFLDFLSSHPGTPDRLKTVRANARQYTAPGDVARDKDSYLASMDGLPYGEDPSEGYVRGRRFLHPQLAFTFTAPDRFTLENTAQAVLGERDSANLALLLDVARVQAEQTPGQYLATRQT